jgi:hypothetical protein
LKDSSNVLMPSSEEELYDENSSRSYDDEYNSESDDDISRKIFGNKHDSNTAEEREKQIYCCICAGKHSELNCPNKQFSRSQ